MARKALGVLPDAIRPPSRRRAHTRRRKSLEPPDLRGPLVVDDEVLGGRAAGPRLTNRSLREDEVDAHRNAMCDGYHRCRDLAIDALGKSNGPSWSCRGCPRFRRRRRNGDVDAAAWKREDPATPMTSALDVILGRIGIPAAQDDVAPTVNVGATAKVEE
jgi:hypothetical protein